MKHYILALVLAVAGISAVYAVNPIKEGNMISGHVIEKGIRGEKRNVSICGGPENDRLLWLSKRYGGVGESGLEKRSVYIALHWAYI